MRPKFRAYHKFLKKMLIPEKLWLDDGRITAFTAQGEPENVFQVRRDSEDYGLELMQSTGLLDKNGQEIYEGDIVANLFYEGKKSLVIERENEYGGFNILYFLQECVINKDTREVVGNIYENPELLSQK